MNIKTRLTILNFLEFAVWGAYLNVKINASGLKDEAKGAELIAEATALTAEADRREKAIIEIVEEKMK